MGERRCAPTHFQAGPFYADTHFDIVPNQLTPRCMTAVGFPTNASAEGVPVRKKPDMIGED